MNFIARNSLSMPAFCGLLMVILSGCAAKQGDGHADRGLSPTQMASVGAENARETENPIILEEELEAQEKGELPSWDIPVTRNAHVEQWLKYFQGRGRKWYHRYMERSGRYIPFMRRILRDNNLPEDLVYLAMIESGFSPKAYSRARASGLWQFIKGTGRLYGLRTSFWVDERRDPEKSTIAAARHLKDLYDQFQSWKLAAAAYNAGAGKVERAIKRYQTEDFWELTKGRYLKAETRNYVPKLIAAALIAKEPEKYGFTDIQYNDPLEYDKIIVKEPLSIETIARKAGYTKEDLMDINPELNQAVTPPDVAEYELRVPPKSSEKFLAAISNLNEDEKFKFASHTIRRGDTLSVLAKRYRVPSGEILRLNNLRSHKHLRPGKTIVIPVPQGAQYAEISAPVEEPVYSKKKTARHSKENKMDDKVVHVVRRGESLWSIAQRYRISVFEIKNENHLRRNQIAPGKRLVIPSGNT